MKKCIAAGLFLGMVVSSHAAVLAHYEFDSSTYADSAGYAGVTAADLALGAGHAADSSTSNWTTPFDGGTRCFYLRGAALNVTEGSTSAAFVTATSQGNFFELTLTSTQPMNLTSLGFDVAKNDSNAHSFRVLATSDLTGHTYLDRLSMPAPAGAASSLADIIQSNQEENLSNVVQGAGTDWGWGDNAYVDLSGPEFQGVNSVTLRMYGFAIAASTPSQGDILRFDNIMVNGTVIPEPGVLSLVMLGLGGLALLKCTRR